jgi:hypothetical protein
MRPAKRSRLTARVVLIVTIAAGVALAITGAGAALADVVWSNSPDSSVSVEVGGAGR